MNAAAFLLTLFAPFLLLGQQTDPAKKQRASIGFTVSPTYSYRMLKSTSADDLVLTDRNDLEIPRLSYDAGVSITVPVGERFALESGLWISRKGYSTRSQVLNWSETEPSFPLSSVTRYTYNFLSIPAKVSYAFGRSKLRFFVAGGLAMNVFIVQQIDVLVRYPNQQSHSSNSKQVGVSRFNLVSMVSGGFRYRLSTKINLKLEPNFQYFMTPLRPGLSVREHLYSGGLTVGLQRRF